MSDRTEEEIEAEIETVRGQLDDLLAMPAHSVIHGQTVDNRANIDKLQRRLLELNNELAGKSVFQGPDLEV